MEFICSGDGTAEWIEAKLAKHILQHATASIGKLPSSSLQALNLCSSVLSRSYSGKRVFNAIACMIFRTTFIKCMPLNITGEKEV